MNRQKFDQLLENQDNLTLEDLKQVDNLSNIYPYSQVVHALSAVGSYRQKTKDAKKKLNVAAVYAADRSVLKEIILSEETSKPVQTPAVSSPQIKAKPKTPSESEQKAKPTKVEAQPSKPEPERVAKKSSALKDRPAPTPKAKAQVKKSAPKTVVDKPSDHPGHLTSKEAEALRNEVMKNLEDLMIAKEKFMKLVGEESQSKPKTQPKTKAKTTAKTTTKTTVKKKPEKSHLKVTKRKSSSSKKQSEKVSTSDTKAASKKTRKRSVQKEQNEIIDKFIKEDPSISKGKSRVKDDNQSDLSRGSVKFGEDLVSENLAQIMIKQGKKDKAVDIYKKLIWKYPQKKAYFASQIESIKEK